MPDEASAKRVSIATSAIGGDVVGRDKIVNNIQHIHQRTLTATEQAQQAQEFELLTLAQGVSAFVSRLQARASESADKGDPYKGLLEYRLGDAEIFFGRQQATDELLRNLERGRLTVLHSESGAGKTSLLQAGVSPPLIAAGHLPLYLRPYTTEPASAIKRAFVPNLNQTPTLAAAPLRDFLHRVGGVIGIQTTLYVFVDQFEEFFTRLVESSRDTFVCELAECLDDDTLNVRWLLALRSEYFSNLASFRPQIRSPFENDYRLNRLTRVEAQAVIAQPAARRGIVFESGLIETLIDDLGRNEIAPPQIQLVCSVLFKGLKLGETTITHESYTGEGGAAGILRGHLERVLSRDLPAPHRAPARRLLESLITYESKRDIRTRQELAAELTARDVTPEMLDTILAQLVDSRLLRAEEDETGLAYELAHDYLLDEIRLNPAVLARKQAQEIVEHKVQHGTLLSEDEWVIVESRRKELTLSAEAKDVIRRTEEKRKNERRRLVSIAVLTVILVIVAIFSAVGALGATRVRNAALTREAAANRVIGNLFEQTGIIPVGDRPVAFSSDGARLWVANFGDHTIQAIDPHTGATLATVRVGAFPIALAFDGVRLWATHNEDNTVMAIDPASGRTEPSIPIDGRVRALAFDGKRLWVVTREPDAVWPINVATGEVGQPIAVDSLPNAVYFDGTRLWVVNTGSSTVQAIDPDDEVVIETIPVGAFTSAIAFDGRRLWLASIQENKVVAFDLDQRKVLAPIQVGDAPGALAFDETRIWVANRNDATVQAIDPETGAVSAPIPVGHTPYALAYNGGSLWIANFDDETIQAVYPPSGDVGQAIGVGSRPSALIFDGHKLWVADQGSESVQWIDPDTGETGVHIAAGAFPAALAFDGKRLWVANASLNAIRAIDPLTGESASSLEVAGRPLDMLFDGMRLWVAFGGVDAVQAIDPDTGRVSPPISVGSSPSALAFDGQRLWVANRGDATVQAIDPDASQVIMTVSAGAGPNSLVYDGKRLWVTNRSDDAVQAIDPEIGDVSSPIKVGNSPTALAFDGQYVWVANAQSESVQAIDPATGETRPPIPVGLNPSALAFDGQWLWVLVEGAEEVKYVITHK